MLVINAQIKSTIDLIVTRKKQIKENKKLYKNIEQDINCLSNTEIIEILTKYPDSTFTSYYDEILLCYRVEFSKEDQQIEDHLRISNMKYAQNKINNYMERAEENKTQVLTYLKAKNLEYIFD